MCYSLSVKQIQQYLKLTKPGVLFGNVLTAVAGYLFASSNGFYIGEFAAMLTGTTLVIASACTLNNYLDQDIDAKMERTKSRPLIDGSVSPAGALLFAIVLGIAGVFILQRLSDPLVLLLGIIGFITYVWLYGAFTKRQSVHGTLVGSVSGAIPILAGYVAAAHTIDVNAALLFLILFFWQEPEFYSIAIYRREEYKTAGIPVISVIHGVDRTVKEIFTYTFLFIVATLLLAIAGSASYTYLAVMTSACLYWIHLGWQGFQQKNTAAWARRMFHASINMLLLLCLMLSIDRWMP